MVYDDYPEEAFVLTGPVSPEAGVDYGGITGPISFTTGGGAHVSASSGSGDYVGIFAGTDSNPAYLALSGSYVSGSELSSASTWDNATLSSLDLVPGTYVWTWGAGPTRTASL